MKKRIVHENIESQSAQQLVRKYLPVSHNLTPTKQLQDTQIWKIVGHAYARFSILTEKVTVSVSSEKSNG